VFLPLIGAPFAPVNDKRYLRGLYAWENRWLHITRGVGNLHGIRFNCRTEVSVLEIG
jgi:predicted MPP superfamily phosphohydrolase